ncbi:uncharacterized protein EV420DRAFT_662051 [Desarmillaria tabescens]|uniref:Uncharacterized protein n=1 Tax=Armillaria tabescens TaxID=1929756 RepID=A0AA39TYV2_ARMTA|nr:uncharacterized protein EV420DRAFT_662051 [Desarmillaria tabescens]KAK0467039.1 hypothetical protein EV420DRAFT_662051 [Desarmillaria tabescens]
MSSPISSGPICSVEELEYHGPESDVSSSATDLFDNDSRDDESTTSSAGSASKDDLDPPLFDPRLLVSPRKSRPSSVLPTVSFGYGRGTGEAAGIWDLELAVNEPLCWGISLLSEAALCLRTLVTKGTNVKNGVSYPLSFTGKDLLATLRACIEEEHDDTDTPLPLESLVLDIARSLQTQFLFCEVGSQGWGEETIYNSEECIYMFLDDQEDPLSIRSDDEIPTGVVPMLTRCYSPTCSDDWPCFSYACPRWGYAQPSRQSVTVGSKVEPSGVKTSSARPADIIPLLDHIRDMGRTLHPIEFVSDCLSPRELPPIDTQVASTRSEGDLLNSYWELVEKMDVAFDTGFGLEQFPQEVTAKVDSIADSSRHPEPKRFQYKWLLALCISFPFVYVLSLNILPLLDFAFV